MKKLSFLFASFLVLSAQAAHLVLPANVQTDLPSCGGTIQTNQSNGQYNLIFRNVKDCSNFDIVATDFGIIDANYQAKKIPENGSGTRSGSFTIPQAYIDRGLNTIRVEVKSNKGAHSDTIDLVFVAGPSRPQPVPVNPTSLKGRCQDNDHSNFAAAKSFAYSPSGLNMSDSQATNWALDYQNSHRCNTIAEYQARFTELKKYAYSPSYMNKSDSEAAQFALQNVEETTAADVKGWMATFTPAQQFFYSPSYLNMDSSRSSSKADQWVRRGCGSIGQIEQIKAEFTNQYKFAYSPSGLNKSSSEAIQYAVQKISGMSRCSDLFR